MALNSSRQESGKVSYWLALNDCSKLCWHGGFFRSRKRLLASSPVSRQNGVDAEDPLPSSMLRLPQLLLCTTPLSLPVIPPTSKAAAFDLSIHGWIRLSGLNVEVAPPLSRVFCETQPALSEAEGWGF